MRTRAITSLLAMLLSSCLTSCFNLGNKATRTGFKADFLQMTSSLGRDPTNELQKVLSRTLLSAALLLGTGAGVGLPPAALARPEGVNRPDLLPKEQTTVIDVANFLTKGFDTKFTAHPHRFVLYLLKSSSTCLLLSFRTGEESSQCY